MPIRSHHVIFHLIDIISLYLYPSCSVTLHNIDLLCYFGSERGDVKNVQTGDTNFVENDLMNTLHQMRVQLRVVFFLTKEHEQLSTTISHRRKLLQTQGAQEVSVASNSLLA